MYRDETQCRNCRCISVFIRSPEYDIIYFVTGQWLWWYMCVYFQKPTRNPSQYDVPNTYEIYNRVGGSWSLCEFGSMCCVLGAWVLKWESHATNITAHHLCIISITSIIEAYCFFVMGLGTFDSRQTNKNVSHTEASPVDNRESHDRNGIVVAFWRSELLWTTHTHKQCTI